MREEVEVWICRRERGEGSKGSNHRGCSGGDSEFDTDDLLGIAGGGETAMLVYSVHDMIMVMFYGTPSTGRPVVIRALTPDD
jgi:hypothetical protein